MVETLEHLIRQVAEHPRLGRAALYRELLRSETFLLTVDQPLERESLTRVTPADESFPIWADQDPEMGGVWVPIFPARDSVNSFVSSRHLEPPRGMEFLWMGHKPGAVFGILRGVRCFAGLMLYLDEKRRVEIPWADVKALSEGRLPSDDAELFELPVARLVLPVGLKLAFGSVKLASGRHKLLVAPQAGRFRPEDMRKLVRLPLEGGDHALTPCRHFLQILRHVAGEENDAYIEDLLCSLIGFQLYGEAEALCDWIIQKGGELYAKVALAAIYARTGRLSECADLCENALEAHPAEKAFALNGARALMRLGQGARAAALLKAALEKAGPDAALEALLSDCLSGATTAS